jgi:hypothetical protein
MTPEQKALITAYAETEKNVEGTISGITNTEQGGKFTATFVLLYSFDTVRHVFFL